MNKSVSLPWIWMNGRLQRAGTARVSIFDRSFQMGDGVFETLRILDGCPIQWRAHWQRLKDSARWSGIKIPASESACRDAIASLIHRNRAADAVLRIHLSRGIGPRGYSIRGATEPQLILSLHPAITITPGRPDQQRLAVLEARFSGILESTARKTASRIMNVVAKMDSEQLGFDDALLLDADGHVAEAVGSNVFWINSGTLYTPPLSLGILPGTARRNLIQFCRRNNVPCVELTAGLETVLRSEGAFLTVSTRGIIEIVALGKTKLKRSPLTNWLHEELENQARTEARKYASRVTLAKKRGG